MNGESGIETRNESITDINCKEEMMIESSDMNEKKMHFRKKGKKENRKRKTGLM